MQIGCPDRSMTGAGHGAVVGIAGAGGIGSNVAAMLVRSGVNRLCIVDFDAVAPSNLNRQFFFADQVGRPKVAALAQSLRRIDARADIAVCEKRLTADNLQAVFASAAVIVEGVDVPETKKQIVEVFAAAGKPVVSASGIAGADTSGIRIRRLGNCWVVGDLVSEAGEGNLFAHKVIMVAAEMTRIVLALVQGEGGR